MKQGVLDLPAGDTIPAISLWQPWATWILWGWKTIETRLHDRFAKLEGRRIAIHASVTWDQQAISAASPYLTKEQVEQTYKLLPRDWKAGCLLCSALVEDYRLTEPGDAKRALIECDTPRVGLWLKDIQPIEPPIAMRGHQGIWMVEL
jgi:hypothetical protein